MQERGSRESESKGNESQTKTLESEHLGKVLDEAAELQPFRMVVSAVWKLPELLRTEECCFEWLCETGHMMLYFLVYYNKVILY